MWEGGIWLNRAVARCSAPHWSVQRVTARAGRSRWRRVQVHVPLLGGARVVTWYTPSGYVAREAPRDRARGNLGHCHVRNQCNGTRASQPLAGD